MVQHAFNPFLNDLCPKSPLHNIYYKKISSATVWYKEFRFFFSISCNTCREKIYIRDNRNEQIMIKKLDFCHNVQRIFCNNNAVCTYVYGICSESIVRRNFTRVNPKMQSKLSTPNELLSLSLTHVIQPKLMQLRTIEKC